MPFSKPSSVTELSKCLLMLYQPDTFRHCISNVLISFQLFKCKNVKECNSMKLISWSISKFEQNLSDSFPTFLLEEISVTVFPTFILEEGVPL